MNESLTNLIVVADFFGTVTGLAFIFAGVITTI